ncbi:hypothetical protein ZWY2020_048901 [Hordeum vulgare]|nr:hypothetical protein ZWY2020_048901 [Hordeum vulgare]
MGAMPRPAPGVVGLPGRGSPQSTTPGPPSAGRHLLVIRRGIPACRCRVRRGTVAAWRPPAADLDRNATLRAELVACHTPASQPRDERAARGPPARDLDHRPAAPSWRRDRQDHRRGERWGGPPMRRGDDGRHADWRSSRAEGADWRLDDGPSRHVPPEALPAAPLPAPVVAKKKKKSKKKKVDGSSLGGAVGLTPPRAQGNRQRSREDTMCINYGCAGHYRSECEAPPRCPTTLAYLGYGTERGSFYFVDAEIEEVAARPHLATVTLEPEQPIPDGLVISSDLIRDELAAYIGDFRGSEFAWEVTETAPLVFSVPFPSAELLRVCSHGPIRCPLNQFLISVQAATSEPDPVPPLEKDDGPARIEILCPAPAEIDGLSLVFYFGSKGRRLTFELESLAPVVQLDPAPSGPEPGDGGLDEEGGSSEEGSSSEGGDDMVGAPPEPSGGRRNPAPSAAGQSGLAGGSTVGTLASVVAVGTEITLPASPIPVVAAEEEVSVGPAWPDRVRCRPQLPREPSSRCACAPARLPSPAATPPVGLATAAAIGAPPMVAHPTMTGSRRLALPGASPPAVSMATPRADAALRLAACRPPVVMQPRHR